jgi:hypothetical protein
VLGAEGGQGSRDEHGAQHDELLQSGGR